MYFLSGALFVYPTGIDIEFLKAFNVFIRDQISSKRGDFYSGGWRGDNAPVSGSAQAVRAHDIENIELDWLGIHATRLNAQMVRTIFQDIADPRVIKHYEVILKIDKPIAVAAGWKPGWSTDFCAVTLCEDYGIKSAINMTNVDQVYDKDPRKFPDAKPMVKTTWEEYRRLAGDKWTPGMNLPFDPIASRLADENGVTVKILNGKNLPNLAKALDNEPFVGTTISNR